MNRLTTRPRSRRGAVGARGRIRNFPRTPQGRLGLRRPRLEELYEETGSKAVCLCVIGRGTVRAAFDGRGRVRLVVSTARGHTARGIRAGSSRRAFRRRFRGERRVRGTTVWRAGRYLVAVRRNRVRSIGLVPRRTGPRGIRIGVRNAGLGLR